MYAKRFAIVLGVMVLMLSSCNRPLSTGPLPASTPIAVQVQPTAAVQIVKETVVVEKQVVVTATPGGTVRSDPTATVVAWSPEMGYPASEAVSACVDGKNIESTVYKDNQPYMVFNCARVRAYLASLSTPAPADAADSPGQCHVINDYQLKDLPELSVVDGGYLHVEWYSGGDPERETVFPSGRYTLKSGLAGHVWEYSPACKIEEVLQQVADHTARRLNLMANNAGYTHYKELLQGGKYAVATTVKMTGDANIPDKLPKASKTSSSQLSAGNTVVTTTGTTAGVTSGSCKATNIGDSDNMTSITAPANTVYSVETWGGTTGDAFVIIPPGGTVNRTWQGGALWSYPCSDLNAVLKDVSGRGKAVMLLKNGILVKQ